MKPEEVWELTPAELYEMADAYNKRMIKKKNEMMYYVWHTAVFVRTDEMPSLDSLMIKDDIKHVQSDEEMMLMARVLNAAFGGEEVVV